MGTIVKKINVKIENIIGFKYGYWTAMEPAGKDKDNADLVLCKCQCGNLSKITLSKLLCNRATMCRDCSLKKLHDLTGNEYGKLTVEEKIKIKGNKTKWRCYCSCGNIKDYYPYQLKQGIVKDCGCVKNNKIKNRYVFHNEYCILYTNTEKEVLIDREEYEKIKKYKWRENNYGYIITYANNTMIWLHRYVMGELNADSKVDHINRNPLDNRKSNLRLCSPTENARNLSIRKNNTSGVTGVSKAKNPNKWRAAITVNRKVISLGVYENFEDAVNARKEAEIKYFGEFAPRN